MLPYPARLTECSLLMARLQTPVESLALTLTRQLRRTTRLRLWARRMLTLMLLVLRLTVPWKVDRAPLGVRQAVLWRVTTLGKAPITGCNDSPTLAEVASLVVG